MLKSPITFEIPIEYFELELDGFRPLFALGNSVLIERFTGKHYTYKIVNIITKSVKHIYSSINQLQSSKYNEAANKIYEIYQLESLASLKFHSLNKLLNTQCHIFTQILTKRGYCIRENQIELAENMLKSLYNKQILLAEAGVGTGKTFAYIIASILSKENRKNEFSIRGEYKLSNDFSIDTPMPIIISTSSIALQKAITKDYIPQISNALLACNAIKQPLTCVTRKGKEHYICDIRLKQYIEDSKRANVEFLMSLTGKTFLSIDLDELDTLDAYTKARINVCGCHGNRCPLYKDCRYILFREHVNSSYHDFQVCNHNYLLADISKRAENKKALMPNYQTVIIDEAHKFLQAARQIYGQSISEYDIFQVKDTLESIKFDCEKERRHLGKLSEELIDLNGLLFNGLKKNIRNEDCDDDAERFETRMDYNCRVDIGKMLETIKSLLEAIDRKVSIPHYHKVFLIRLKFICEDLYKKLDHFLKPTNIIFWIELSKEQNRSATLCSVPKNVPKLLYQELWSKTFPTILTSGTLSLSKSFTHTKNKLGLDLVPSKRLIETISSSPFNYSENCLIYISENVRYPNYKDHRYIEELINEIERILHVTHGHAAILFTSYKIMEIVYNAVEKRMTMYPLFRLTKGNLATVENFKKSRNGILFASGSMWEGIDIPGDILSAIIFPKLPFPVPDPISKYEQRLFESEKEYINNRLFPEMMEKFCQGVGRLIRSESDTGVIFICDVRVATKKAYRAKTLQGLPQCEVTSKLDDVDKFFKLVKNDEYFI